MIANNQHKLSFFHFPAVNDFSDSEVMQAMLAHDLAGVRMRQRCNMRRYIVTAMMDELQADAARVDVGIEVAKFVPALQAFAGMLATSACEVQQGQLLPDFGVSLALEGNALQVAGTSAFTACLCSRVSDVLEALEASFPNRRIAHHL